MANLVADARALAAGQYGHLVVYGSTAIGDGGGGFYVWNAASADVDDGADWLKPNAITHPAPGRWQRVWSATQAATTLLAGLVMLGADGETTAGEAVQCSDTRLHPAASLAGTPAYFTIDGATQVITRALVNLASHVTGTLPILNGGTGAGTAADAFAAIKQLASETATGVVELATSAETTAGLALQASDTRIHPAATLAGTPNYLTIVGATQVITRALIDLTTHVTGLLPILNGGTGASTAAAAFTALKQAATTTATGVVELATDGEVAANVAVQGNDGRLHAAVTLAGTPAYLTLSGQQITRVLIDLASHVTGLLPLANLANLVTVTESAASHTNSANDHHNFVRWTNTGAKTYTISSGVAIDGDTWQGINVGANNLTFTGSGVTLTGNLIFASLKTYTLRFTSASAADVIGGSAT